MTRRVHSRHESKSDSWAFILRINLVERLPRVLVQVRSLEVTTDYETLHRHDERQNSR